MNAAHLHLALIHFPIAGLVLACLGLLYAAMRKDMAVQRAALLFLAVAGLSAAPAYYSGGYAEEIAEDLQGVSEQTIHAHEEAAEAALAAALAAGALSAGLLVLFRKKDPPRIAMFGALGLAALAAALTGRAGNLGGAIRHPEIEMTAPPEKGEAGETAEGGEDSGKKEAGDEDD